MNKFEKKLKKEVNSFEISPQILSKVKTDCGIKNSKPKKVWQLCAISVFSCAALILVLCLTLIKPGEFVDLNTYVAVTFSSQVSANSIGEKKPLPAFELVLDCDGVLKKEKALNESAVLLLADSNPSTDLKSALEKIVLQANKMDFLLGNSLSFLTINNFKEKEQAIESAIEGALNNISEEHKLEFDFLIEEGVSNEFGISESQFSLAQRAQTKFGGEIEQYLKMDVSKLLELLFEYNEKTLNQFETAIEQGIETIKQQYSSILQTYAQLVDACTSMLNETKELIESYESSDFLSEVKYELLVSKLKIFILQNASYFEDLDADDLEDDLKEDEIKSFYATFENCCQKLEQAFAEIEASLEKEIVKYKLSFFN